MFITLGCSVAKGHAVLKIKCNQDYSTKLIEISLFDKINDFESYHVLNLIFKTILGPSATLSTYFLNDPRNERKKLLAASKEEIYLSFMCPSTLINFCRRHFVFV